MLRYAVQLLLHNKVALYNFPWATFSVNIVGSFMIGLFYALSVKFQLSEELRLYLTAGLCGGFTTFSTFSNDSIELLKQGEMIMFVIYVLASITFGILAALAGALIIKF